MRELSRALWVLGLAAAVACGDDDANAPSPTPDPADVSVRDNFFQPAEVTVTRTDGTAEVDWAWNGNNPHNVTFDAGPPNSGTQTSGSFSRSFDEAGRFTYFCTVHGREVMSGAVEVQ